MNHLIIINSFGFVILHGCKAVIKMVGNVFQFCGSLGLLDLEDKLHISHISSNLSLFVQISEVRKI